MFFFHRSGVVSDFPGFVVVVVVKNTPKTEKCRTVPVVKIRFLGLGGQRVRKGTVPLLAFVSEFNCGCFLQSRCSMEMWCLDDRGRDSWD